MKKLGLSIISVFLAFVTLVSSTFAWISINQTVYVDGLELTVTSGENILLSVDGVHWYQNLTNEQIIQAIVAKYRGYEFNDDEEVIVPETGDVISLEEVKYWYENKISLAPLTSTDGKKIEDLYGNEITSTLGKFVEFDLYFTCEGDALSEDADVFFYHGIDKTLPDGTVVPATRITSEVISVPLKNHLVSYDQLGNAVNHYAVNDNNERQYVSVNPANALRFSTNDIYNQTAKIYELAAYNSETNTITAGLGSYATDYTSYKEETGGAFMAAYDATKNAGFTYYNNLKTQDLEPLAYNEMPQTVRKFDSLDNARVCQLKSVFGYEAKVTFKFWLEGWDADCFDGIGNTKTKIDLTFTTKSEVDYEPINVAFYDSLSDEEPFAVYANANPGMYLSPALAPVGASKFKGWAVVMQDGTVDEKVFDETVTLKNLVTSYYSVIPEEFKLVAVYE